MTTTETESAAPAAARIGEFVAGLRYAQLPEPVLAATELHMLDALGCGLAAAALGEASHVVAAADEIDGSGPATAIGMTHTLPSTEAALVNGVLCHALDFDDTHEPSVVHVSAAVTPAALAEGQQHSADPHTVLVAIIAGNEVSTRIGAAAGGLFHARGFHASGVCGVFGATAAAARVRRLDAEHTAHALGIAGSMASGLLEFLADGADTKRLHPGWAAHAGITAARLAAHGATGPATVFEGRRGLYAAYLHGCETDLAGQLATLGREWNTPTIAYKPYPACHYTHAPMDALAAILAEHPLSPEDIEQVTGFTDQTGVGLVAEPAEDKLRPRTPYDAKFSLPYCLASMIVRGRVEVAAFTPSAIAEPGVLELTPKVGYETVTLSETPDSFGGGARVRTTDGRTFEKMLRYQRGSTQYPMSEGDVLEKYRRNAGLALGQEAITTVEKSVRSLAECADLGFLSELSG
jgi:2-methylcitrate dehydratase PrpD